MSYDTIVLTSERPEVEAALRELRGRPVQVRSHPGGLHVHDERERLLVAIGEPLLVRVAGEVERLLATPVDVPVWWLEVRAAAEPADAVALAGTLAQELVRRHGGQVWAGAR
jgi:hypothetical protein